jgi:hypothetical protein
VVVGRKSPDGEEEEWAEESGESKGEWLVGWLIAQRAKLVKSGQSIKQNKEINQQAAGRTKVEGDEQPKKEGPGTGAQSSKKSD